MQSPFSFGGNHEPFIPALVLSGHLKLLIPHSTLLTDHYFFSPRGLGASAPGAAALAMPLRISVSAMVFCIW